MRTSNTRPPSSLAARGRNSLAGRWQPTSSSTRRPRRHPQVGSALMPSTRSRPSAAGPSPSCRLTPMADHDRPSDRWVAVRGSCRRLPSDRLWTCRDYEMHERGAWVMARDMGALRGGRGVGYGGVREARERAHATCRRYLTMRPVMHAPGPAPVRACFPGAPCASTSRRECT